ncbi:MAG: YihY/virulence factor BrkB family protein [Anaerolineae bacterium]|nr:YihY/virulence factor BrkB family protein [Anaerolineae bacterium]
MKIIKAIFELLRDAAIRWSEDKASMFAAALAYYTVFSLAPLLVLGVAIAKRILRESNVQEMILTYASKSFEPQIAEMVAQILDGAVRNTSTVLATVISTIILLWGATGVFNHLKRALNTIWGVEPELPTGLHGVIYFIKTRGLAALMVLGVGFLFVAAFVLNTIMSTLDQYLVRWFPQFSVHFDNALLSFVLSWIVPVTAFAIVLKALPDAKVAWRDVWLGAVVTAVLFAIGNYAISFYLSRSSAASAYGAAGSLIVMLLWIYYSAQIFFYGAEFTQIYANRYGSKVVPASHAVAIRRERVNNHQPAPELEMLPAYLPEPLYLPERGDSPARQKAKQLGFGMIGLAIGLFLGFLGSLNRE